jgi:WS/DGAT/MGAT family acyltransferase
VAEPLSPADRSSLAAEQGAVSMAVAAALVFDAGPGLAHEQVVERLRSRLHLIPRYRQRLAQTPLGLANPVWADDPDFDLEWHVRRATLPAPGGDAELADLIAREVSRRLDRARPLWELSVIDGLAGGRVALLAKMHHALVDGIAAVDVGTVLLDPTEEPMEVAPPDRPWEPEPYDRARHLTRLAATPLLRGQRALVETIGRAREGGPRAAADDLRAAGQLAVELARQRPQAPMTPLNEPLSPNRRYALTRCPLDDLKTAGKAAGGTVNDALLAAVAGMLRGYLEGVELERPPVALVPVSIRADGDDGRLGNRISTVFVDLPIEEADPVARIRTVAATMRSLKDSAAVRAGAMLVGATGWAPPAVSSMLVRAMGGVRAFNLVVSNVPGPQQPFFLAGSRLRETFPVVPLNPANQRLAVGILSYDGGVFFGLSADRRLDPPVEAAREALEAALSEVLASA